MLHPNAKPHGRSLSVVLLLVWALGACRSAPEPAEAPPRETPSMSRLALLGDTEGVTELLDAGADVDSANESGETLLSIAASRGHVALAAVLVERGADLEAASTHGTPLVRAARSGSLELVTLLVESGADVNSTARRPGEGGGSSAILHAIIRNDFEMFDYLIAHGADVNQGTYIEGEGAALVLVGDLNASVMSGTVEGNLRMLRLVLENGFDVDQQVWYGTALSVAVAGDQVEATRILIEFGADPATYIDELGMTVYELALRRGNADIVLLLEEGRQPPE